MATKVSQTEEFVFFVIFSQSRDGVLSSFFFFFGNATLPPPKMSYVLFPLLLEIRSLEMFKPWLKAEVILHKDTTSWSSPPSSRISFPFLGSISQGTRVDGLWIKFGDTGSTDVQLSVSFHFVSFTGKPPGEHRCIVSWDWPGDFM